MKKDIHPKYYNEAKVSCACGAKFVTGSTEPEIEVEICSNCHPFYTNTQKLIDTAGRLDRFKERLAKSAKRKVITNTKEQKAKKQENQEKQVKEEIKK